MKHLKLWGILFAANLVLSLTLRFSLGWLMDKPYLAGQIAGIIELAVSIYIWRVLLKWQERKEIKQLINQLD